MTAIEKSNKRASTEDEARLADYPYMLRVVCAAWDLLEGFEEDVPERVRFEVERLRKTLTELADRGMK